VTCEAWRPGRAGDPSRGLDQDDVPCAGKSRSGRTHEPCRELGPVPQIGQFPSPRLSNQTVQPGPSRSTIETFCFGTGAKTADFSILPDAVSRPRMQHRPSSTQSEAEPNNGQRDNVTPTFVLIEVLAFLKARKIVRPGYTTLQSIITDALTAERRRLGQLMEGSLDADTNAALRKLLVREDRQANVRMIRQHSREGHAGRYGFLRGLHESSAAVFHDCP
jgi:hypothetical protein